MTPLQTVIDALEQCGCNPRGNGNGWAARCPGHDDQHASLSIGEGDDGCALVFCHATCKTADVLAALGLAEKDLFPNSLRTTGKDHRKIVATYDYTDAEGKLLFQAVRFEPKSFRQRRPDGKGGWTWKLGDAPRVLYCLPELLAADPDAWVFIVEGEKDVDNLRDVATVATCNPMGAGKWAKLSDDSALHGRRVAIIPDRDGPGRKHAIDVASRLHGKAAEVRIIDLPDGDGVKDVSDWIECRDALDVEELGHALEFMADSAPPFEPSAVVSTSALPASMAAQPFEPFPVELLPGAAAVFVREAACALGCDPSYLALPVLAGMAAAIGNTRRLELRAGTWEAPPILWALIVGESGTTKSPAIRQAMAPVYAIQEEALKAHDAEVERHEMDRMRHERELKRWRAGEDAADPPREPDAPVAVRYWTSDVTTEALAAMLSVQPRGLLLIRDELGGWMADFNRYANGRGGDVPRWLEMYDGGAVVVDRKGAAGPIHVPRAAVCITGGIQPGTLRRELRPEYFECGLAARLLLAWPPRQRKRWGDQKDLDPEIGAGLDAVFRRLYDLRHAEDGDPVIVKLDADAKEAWTIFYDAHNAELSELTDELASAFSKLEGAAARLALVIHLGRQAAGEPVSDAVDRQSMDAGIGLARWFAREVRRVYAMLRERPEQHERRELAELIRRKGGTLSSRELMRCRRQCGTADAADTALTDLVAAGLAVWQDVPPTAAGGRPTRRVRLVDTADVDTTPEKPTVAEVLSTSTAE